LFPLKWLLPCNSVWCPFAMPKLGIGLGVTSFNVSNIVTTKAIQHLFAIMNEKWEAPLWLNYSIECKILWNELNLWMGEINTTMLMRVAF
jgi:hypothetical protein